MNETKEIPMIINYSLSEEMMTISKYFKIIKRDIGINMIITGLSTLLVLVYNTKNSENIMNTIMNKYNNNEVIIVYVMPIISSISSFMGLLESILMFNRTTMFISDLNDSYELIKKYKDDIINTSWLITNESYHELLLNEINGMNPFASQFMLSTLPLYQLITSSSDVFNKQFKDIMNQSVLVCYIHLHIVFYLIY